MTHELRPSRDGRPPFYRVNLSCQELAQAGWASAPIAHVQITDGRKVADVQFRVGIERGKLVWRVEDFGADKITAKFAKPRKSQTLDPIP